MKRHYDSNQKKDFYSAYPGKGERLKEFKECFDAYVGEAKSVGFLLKVRVISTKLAVASVTPLLNTRCRLLMPKCSKRLSRLVPKLYVRFSEQRETCRIDYQTAAFSQHVCSSL